MELGEWPEQQEQPGPAADAIVDGEATALEQSDGAPDLSLLDQGQVEPLSDIGSRSAELSEDAARPPETPAKQPAPERAAPAVSPDNSGDSDRPAPVEPASARPADQKSIEVQHPAGATDGTEPVADATPAAPQPPRRQRGNAPRIVDRVDVDGSVDTELDEAAVVQRAVGTNRDAAPEQARTEPDDADDQDETPGTLARVEGPGHAMRVPGVQRRGEVAVAADTADEEEPVDGLSAMMEILAAEEAEQQRVAAARERAEQEETRPEGRLEIPRRRISAELDRDLPMTLGYEAGPGEYERGGAVRILPSEIKSIAAVGGTQNGKSEFMRYMTEELVRRGGAVIVITPARGLEWYTTLGKLGLPVEIIDGSRGRLGVTLPLFQPVPGFSRAKHNAAMVNIITNFAAQGEEGANMFKKGMMEGTRGLLKLHGIDEESGERIEGRLSPPTPVDPEEMLETMLARIRANYDHYPESIAEYVRLRFGGNVEGNAARQVGRRGHPLDIFSLMETPGLKVVNVGDMAGSPEDLAFLMSMYLNAISEAHEVRSERRAMEAMQENRAVLPAPLDLTVIMEEVHRMVMEEGPGAYMTQAINSMFQEFLAGGIRMGIVDQSISSLPDVWLANIGLIAGFRQPHEKDQQAISSILPFPPEIKEQRVAGLAGLRAGYAELFARGIPQLQTPIRIITPWTPNTRIKEIINVSPEIRDRRVPACGALCLTHACENSTVQRAYRISQEESKELATGRVWTTALFRQLTLGVPIGDAPDEFKQRFKSMQDLDPQLADCLVTELVDRVMLDHTRSVELADMPRDLIASTLATIMRETLEGTIDPGVVVGDEFVPPVIRVLQETERISPFEGGWHGNSLRDSDPAPPLLRPIDGVADTVVEFRRGEYKERRVTVAERREALLDCEASLAVLKNREIALGILVGNKEDSTYVEDLTYLWPRANWDQRHHHVEELLDQVPAIRSGASPLRIAASWPMRFLRPNTTEAQAQKKQPVGAGTKK